MKYIDSEKLIAEIEKKKKILVSEYNELAKYEVWRSAIDNKIKINTISDILSLITSLQQEQPEVDLEKEIKRGWEKLEKDYSPSALDKSYMIVSGLIGEKQFSRISRHFYELGLNARKEE